MSAAHSDLINKCLLVITDAGWRAWRVETGVARSMDGRRIIRFGLSGGTDIMGLSPTGRFLACECKTGKDMLTAQQVAFRKMIISMGGLHIVARTPDDVRAALKAEVQAL